jgi:transcription antitermination factor NusG
MAKRWYSVSVLSNFEKKVAEQIKTAVAEAGLQEEIDEVLVPTEEVIEVRRGKKVTSERRFMPGYVLVRMEMSSRGYHLISQINRVTGFLGPHHLLINRTAVLQRCLDRLFGDLVEHHALDRYFGLEHLEQMPANALAFTIFVSRQQQLVSVFQRIFQRLDHLLFILRDHIERLKVTLNIDANLGPVFAFDIGWNFASGLGQIAHMTHRGFDLIACG